MGLAQLGQGADVAPVPFCDIAVDRLALRQQLGKQVSREVIALVDWDFCEHFGLDQVNARVHSVAEHLARPWLFQEALHPPFGIGDDDAELTRVTHPGQADADQGATGLVKLSEGIEVEIHQGITGNHEKGLGERMFGEFYRACCAQGLGFQGVIHLHPEVAAVIKVVADGLGSVVQGGDCAADIVSGQVAHNVFHHGSPQHRDHRLGDVFSQRAQPGPLSPCKNHRRVCHGWTLPNAVTERADERHGPSEVNGSCIPGIHVNGHASL